MPLSDLLSREEDGEETKRTIYFIGTQGNVWHESLTDSELEERDKIPVTGNNLYFEDLANPIDRIEYDLEDVRDEGNLAGFIPDPQWRDFREQDFIDQAMNRKQDVEIPWRPLMVIGGLVVLAIVIFQFI